MVRFVAWTTTRLQILFAPPPSSRFVDNKYVDGWDDPRFPTVRGILRHGTMTGWLVVHASPDPPPPLPPPPQA